MFKRPTLHFAPSKGWINDPNGLICVDGTYHLFAQHNPDDVVWGPMHWLHAVSADRLHWKEQGIALFPDELGTMFSGSAARMEDGRIALMYTAHGESEQQCVAFSRDGKRFEKYPGNPVIANPGAKDFRDPKLFWNDRYGCWSCVLAAGDHLEFYRSENLTAWTKTGEFGFDPVRFGDVYECPDCFRLPTPDGGGAWVLTASMILHAGSDECRMRYCVGEFDGDAFRRTEEWPWPLPVENGCDSYAGTTFAGENVFVAWMSSKSCPLPTQGYCGCLSLPRALKLLKTRDGLRLAQTPVLPEYRTEQCDGALPEGAFVLEIESGVPFELTLRGGVESDFLRIRWTQDNRIETERAVSQHFAKDSAYNSDGCRKTAVPRFRDGDMKLLVVCDEWCVEVFADDGLYTHGLLAFAGNGWRSAEWTDGAQVRMGELI